MIRIGVVGCGTYGTQMLKCFAAQQRRGRVQLVGIAEPDADRRARAERDFSVPAFAGIEQMIVTCGLDAVAIATPDHLHAQPIKAALRAGLHVLTQKPLTTDLQTAERLITAFRRVNRILYVDLHKRFDPAHIRLRGDIAAGRLGQLQYGSVQMEDRIEVPSVWLREWVGQSSPSWFLGVNFYDLVTWLTGLQPRRVWASGHRSVLERMGHAGVWDSIRAKVEYESGFSMHFDLGWILPGSFPSIVNQGIRIVGSKGIVEADSQQRGYFAATQDHPSSVEANPFGASEYDHPLFGPVTDGYVFTAMSYFLDVLDAHAAGLCPDRLTEAYPGGASTLVSIRLAEAVDRSLNSGAIEDV
ncbi:Gfo/Idh/MocA family protein [Paracoccus benzoatiresistens]|uniref:Gfo/Idh/MocA family oxidoreductase n=1 Tax=Paracoccus benzoatiresistens TaxID=2997341 RepID=A0ABT4JBG3_9RHOB|nr:Gfo/Idh/MocA family oxidoreductase [Paracoccus sp. EF6]MCZ0964025.1 Gfo/Idh/MocA family oxidoreductase [Paracoccus sp. EF6]